MGALSVGTAYSQTHRVGINTDNPRATLDISKVASGLPTGQVEGVIFPQMTQAQRNAMTTTQLTAGLMIYNTDKKCIDIWNGTNWQCSDGTKQDNQGDTPSNPSAVLHITQLGFGGVYKAGDALTDDNTVTFKVKNTGSVDSPTLDFSNKVTFTDGSGTSPVTAKSGQHSSFVIGAGREVTLTYVLQGTPRAGNLTAKLTHDGNYAQATVEVKTDVDPQLPQYLTLGNGERSFVSVYDDEYWPYIGPTSSHAQVIAGSADGVIDPLVDIQGKITTTGVEVYIPVTIDPAVGSQPIHVNAFPGTELDISTTHTQDGSAGVIKLSWGAQTLHLGDTYIKAKISAVGQDVNLKKLDFQTGMGLDYKGIRLGEFRYINTQYGTQKSGFTVRLMSGIPDRRFLVKTKDGGGNDAYDHQFIYVPVITPNDYNQYYSLSNQVWLNNNLGAEYTRYGSPVFDPGQQAKEYNDHHAFGSLFQWGRPADGHELVTYTNATTWAFKYGTTPTPTTTYPPQPTENQTVVPTVTTDTATGVDTTPMWFAGTTLPAGFPVTDDNNENDLCPAGFKVPTYGYILDIMALQKPTEKMKEFYLRFPSNPKNVTNNGDNPNYPWKPKLWSMDARYQPFYSSGSDRRTFIVYAQATDVVWEISQQRWSDWKTYPTTLFKSTDSPYYRYIDGTANDYMFRKITNTYSNMNSIIGDAGWYGSYTNSGITTRTINDSYAIRCMKQ